MIEWIKEYMPNAYGLGWSGDYGWGIAIWQTIYMTAGAAIITAVSSLISG